MSPEMTACWVHSDLLGYGRMGVRLAAALERIGVRVVDGQDGETTNCVTWFSVPTHAGEWRAGQYRSILTMFESQRLPEGMTEGLPNLDLVMVPSEQNVGIFSEHHDNVKLVLLGVDPTWHYRERKDPDQWFTFLCGGSGPRKGVDLVTRAFIRMFGDFRGSGPIPRLVMKSPRGAEGMEVGERIEVIGGKISNEEELDLYGSAHCYVQPSRGEGFGLQPLQAIAQGCPTILTDAHGHASFAHLGYGIGTADVESEYFSFGYAGKWWEPDFDELCERMRWVYENYGEAVEFAKKSSEVACREFTWENTARQVVEAIGLDRLTVPYSGSGEIVKASLQKYKVIVNKRWKADIAGVHYSFEPGQVYYESADVLRIMFDAGLLDPSCLEGSQKGLNDRQLSQLGAYSASHSHCETCGHLLNDGPTYHDYLMLKGEVERLRGVPA